MTKIYKNQVDTGRLQVSCFTNNRARPVEGATISLFRADESGNEVQIEELKTDSSGQMAEITLPTPPLDYSFTPKSPMPYAQYNLRVHAEGFEGLTIKDIQVLPDTLALQNCNLFFDEVAAQQTEMETITIDHHTLYYEYPPKQPEDAIKPLPPPTGFVVLDRVVVPETIVVHAGPPDAAAANFYVPFRDYINETQCQRKEETRRICPILTSPSSF